MSLRNTPSSYGSVAKFFHWLIFILVLGMLIFGYCLDSIPKDFQGLAYNIHKLTGLSILGLMLLRLLWALMNPKPLPSFTARVWEKQLERFVHYSLYALLIAMPLAGWIGTDAGGRPPHIGSFNFNLPFALNKALGSAAFSVHNNVAIIIIIFVSLHVLAALYHYLIRKDNVLRRMMPGRST